MKVCGVVLLAAFSLLLPSCIPSHEGMQRVVLTDGVRAVSIWVEIADEPHEYRQGLQARTNLPHDQGMLFVFEFPQPLSFWMKETLIPLDVLFFDEAAAFVGFQTMDPCRRDPCPTYRSPRLAKYALEVNAGFVVQEGVGDGWRIRLPESSKSDLSAEALPVRQAGSAKGETRNPK